MVHRQDSPLRNHSIYEHKSTKVARSQDVPITCRFRRLRRRDGGDVEQVHIGLLWAIIGLIIESLWAAAYSPGIA